VFPKNEATFIFVSKIIFLNIAKGHLAVLKIMVFVQGGVCYCRTLYLLANCAITNMETISPFIDSSIDNVIQTNPEFISCFLNL